MPSEPSPARLLLAGAPTEGAVGLRELLAGQGVLLDHPRAGDALCALAVDARPSLVLIAGDDELDPLEVLRGVQGLCGAGAPPCVVLAGSDRPELLADALRAGAADALAVPARELDLAARIRAHARSFGEAHPRSLDATCFGDGPAGRVFGGLVVVGDLAEGSGWTRVLKAVRLADGGLSALKLLDPGVAAEREEWVRRFAREQELLRGIRHENLAVIRDVGTLLGIPYMEMELALGRALDRRLADGPLSERDALGIALGVARGLAELHGRGIVHRDVKPENVIVGDAGRVRLIDFGLSKPQDERGLTREGEILGTVAFIAPEVLKGNPPEPASDLYALGITLFEMLTGRDAVPGGPPRRTFRETLRGAAQAAAMRSLGGASRELVARLLAVDPRDRYPRIADLISALQAALNNGDMSGTIGGPGRSP